MKEQMGMEVRGNWYYASNWFWYHTLAENPPTTKTKEELRKTMPEDPRELNDGPEGVGSD